MVGVGAARHRAAAVHGREGRTGTTMLAIMGAAETSGKVFLLASGH